jgi:hypothetical protein
MVRGKALHRIGTSYDRRLPSALLRTSGDLLIPSRIQKEHGQGLVEYVLIPVLIAIVVIIQI